MSWIWRISRMLHRIWCFPNNENPDEKSTAPVTYWWNGDLVSDSCIATFPHSPSIPWPPSVPSLIRASGLAKYFPIAKRVWVQKVWKVDTIWEMQFRCSKTCRLLVDAVHILATGHNRPRIPCFQAAHMTTLGAVLYHLYSDITYITF